MASTARKYDCFIFGGGLAGSVLAHTFSQQGKRPLVIDFPGKSRCSQVAAGLINPIGGRRLNLIWKANTLIPFATNFYRSLEESHQVQFYHPRSIARLFASPDERKQWQKRKDQAKYQPCSAPLASLKVPQEIDISTEEGFAVNGSGYLDIPNLVNASRSTLASQEALIESEFEYAEIEATQGQVTWKNRSAHYAIFCEGHLATTNPWFSFVPYKPAKGIIGTIDSDIQLGDTAIIKKYFLLPRHDQTISVGATYNWDQIDEIADPKGIAPENPRILSFNGFGSKGANQTPYFAQTFHDFIWNDKTLHPDVLPSRFIKSTQAAPKRWIAVRIAQERVLKILKPGDSAIDATAGNGHDTLWLAQRTGENGCVFAFDVQTEAIKNARQRIQEANCSSPIHFIADSHSNLSKRLPEDRAIAAAVFNLGYLPGGDQSLITRPDTTIDDGILSVVLYPGHEGGNSETADILKWIQKLDPTLYRHEIERHPTGIARSPYPIFIFKR